MYFSSLRISVLFFLIFALDLASSYYYCSEELQKKLCVNERHFICDPETVPIGGTLFALAPMTSKLKRTFVERHNELRNILAGGQQVFQNGSTFPIATRMREVLWDDELAYIAGQHASRCNMKHDKCRATQRFPGAGQNLYLTAGGKMQSNMTEEALSSMNVWWNEYRLVEDGFKLTAKFPEGMSDWRTIGHFSAMANERAAFVGCGMALCEKCISGAYCLEITCNYSLTNLRDAFMYKSGKSPASECDYYESTPSEKYPNLCVNTGKLFNKAK